MPEEARRLLIALTACLAALGLAEAAARVVDAGREKPSSYTADRNPAYRRDFWAYTQPQPIREDQRLIIVISNSQGFGPELGKIEQLGQAPGLYTAQLQRQLNDTLTGDPNSDRIIVANWSIAGGNGAELMLLAARAAAHEPDAVFIVSHMNTWTKPRLADPLSTYISDVNQFAYKPELRMTLPGWFKRTFRAYSVPDALAANSALVQTGRRLGESRQTRWRPTRVAPPRREPQRRSRGGAALADGLARRMLQWSVRHLNEHSPNTAVWLITMPLNRPIWKQGAWQNAQQFAALQQQVANETQAEHFDALHTLGTHQFYTHTHFKPRGHSQFAEQLRPLAISALDSDSE